MASKCVVCNERDATLRCRQCHKWVCDSCAFKNEDGAFCERECATKYRDFQKAQPDEEEEERGLIARLVRKIVVLLIVVVLAGILYAYGARKGWLGEREKARTERVIETIREWSREGQTKLKKLNNKAEEKIRQTD